jgi:hypothetical protein
MRAAEIDFCLKYIQIEVHDVCKIGKMKLQNSCPA